MLRTLCGFVIGAAVTSLVLLGTVLAGAFEGVEVRVAARQLADGRVEVAIQQRSGDGWAQRQLPEARFLPADAGAGKWRVSSAVALAGAAPAARIPDGEAEQQRTREAENPAAAAARVSTVDNPDLYCLVTHEQPGDEAFWNIVRQGAKRYGETSTVQHRVLGAPTAAGQSALVRECVAEGAVGIAVTLADPDGLAEAIAEARASGVVVNSFNSGALDYARLGSSRHVALDEIRSGEQAAALFREHGVRGRLLCVVHEHRNVGLDERCDGLTLGHDGEVERFSVAATGVDDVAGTVAALRGRLVDSRAEPIAGVLTLNAKVGLAALDAIEGAELDLALATFDQNADVLQAIIDGRVLFAIDSSPWYQAWFAMSSLTADVYARRILIDNYQLPDPDKIIANIALRLSPEIFQADNAREWLEVSQLIALINQASQGGG